MNKKGLITKLQKELYFVEAEGKVYPAKARGLFRDKNIKPLVGDRVAIQVLDDGTAYIEEVFERKNSLIRPAIANIDQILLVQSLKEPDINYTTFDKYLVMLEHYEIPVVIVINKIDLANKEDIDKFSEIYSNANYKIIYQSAIDNDGMSALLAQMKGKISAFAGPSGVGKSTTLNLLHDKFDAETGDISSKTQRGKHTTRHTELFSIDEDTFVFDTPGFSSLDLSFIEDEKSLAPYFPEFREVARDCKFNNCVHINEPKCMVKEHLKDGKISHSRYDNYLYIYDEIKNERKY